MEADWLHKVRQKFKKTKHKKQLDTQFTSHLEETSETVGRNPQSVSMISFPAA